MTVWQWHNTEKVALEQKITEKFSVSGKPSDVTGNPQNYQGFLKVCPSTVYGRGTYRTVWGEGSRKFTTVLFTTPWSSSNGSEHRNRIKERRQTPRDRVTGTSLSHLGNEIWWPVQLCANLCKCLDSNLWIPKALKRCIDGMWELNTILGKYIRLLCVILSSIKQPRTSQFTTVCHDFCYQRGTSHFDRGKMRTFLH